MDVQQNFESDIHAHLAGCTPEKRLRPLHQMTGQGAPPIDRPLQRRYGEHQPIISRGYERITNLCAAGNDGMRDSEKQCIILKLRADLRDAVFKAANVLLDVRSLIPTLYRRRKQRYGWLHAGWG